MVQLNEMNELKINEKGNNYYHLVFFFLSIVVLAMLLTQEVHSYFLM